MTLEREDCFDNQYYSNIRRFLTIVGLWPYIKSSKRLPYALFISAMLAIGIYTQIYIMLISERKAELIIEKLQTLLPTSLYAFASWNLLYNSTLMKETLERVKSDWDKVKSKGELSVMQSYGAESKKYSQAIICLYCAYCIFLIFPSILRLFLYIFGMVQQNELIMPVHHEMFVATKSVFFIIFSAELMVIAMANVVGIANYSMFISLVHHACALFVIARNKIDQPFIKNEYTFSWKQTGSKRENEIEWIVAVVKYYNNAIEFVDLLTSLYGKMYIVEVLLSYCFLITDFFYFFQLLNFMISVRDALKIFFYLTSSLLVICTYNTLGEKLIEHSTTVYAKCRMVPFYTLSVQTNRLFLIFIMRSMKQCCISIRGTIVSSHELLATMMKASFSFATVCYNLR